VVAYRSGGPEEIIDDGESGFLCAVGDVAAVADRIRLLLGDPEVAVRMGQAARKIALQRFGIERARTALRKLLLI
jgi:glycosyltransferase involved in cell wall biosynthesis